MTKRASEKEYWAYQAFKLAQAVVSMTYQYADRPGIAGHQWLNEAKEAQKHYRACNYPENLIEGPSDLKDWKPEWEPGRIQAFYDDLFQNEKFQREWEAELRRLVHKHMILGEPLGNEQDGDS